MKAPAFLSRWLSRNGNHVQNGPAPHVADPILSQRNDVLDAMPFAKPKRPPVVQRSEAYSLRETSHEALRTEEVSMTDTIPRGLGRRYAPDPRDRRFTLDAERLKTIPRALEPGVRRRTLPWHRGPVLDQGNTSECTVFAAAGFLQCAPRLHPKGLGWSRQQFTDFYHSAQQQDEWPGENYAGTSERAVQKVLQDAGYIGAYLWVADEDIAREYLITRGPLCLGSDWFDSMFTPSAKGAYVDPLGNVAGGHETVVRWYYGPKHYKYPDTYELINSWGESWGEKGIFRLKADGFRYLFLQLNGDLCSPQEKAA